jgi:hypothetical protein
MLIFTPLLEAEIYKTFFPHRFCTKILLCAVFSNIVLLFLNLTTIPKDKGYVIRKLRIFSVSWN